MKKNNYVIIAGCGQFGLHIAERLSSEGTSVVLIDIDPQSFNSLSSEFAGFTIDGDASELEVLKNAKAKQADLFIASTENDNVNLLIAEVAKHHFHVPRVVARITNPKLAQFYQGMEIHAICPTSVSVDMLFSEQLINGEV